MEVHAIEEAELLLGAHVSGRGGSDPQRVADLLRPPRVITSDAEHLLTLAERVTSGDASRVMAEIWGASEVLHYDR